MLHERTLPLEAGDGLPLNLVHVRGVATPTRGPILLVHGAGVRANLFRPPQPNLVDTLAAAGYDVWLLNWRASIDLPPTEWTLDHAALYDHPAAARAVLHHTGADRLDALIHCQGSTSFTMAAVAGLIPNLRTVISNAVSLHTVVPAWSRLKLDVAVPLVHALTPYLSPRWGVDAPDWRAKLIAAAVRLTHHECDNAVCKLVSFTYGSGFPALWKHENLTPETHEWLKGEFAAVPMRFFRQMAKCVRRGHLVRYEPLPGLPADFAADRPKTGSRWVFVAGAASGCFKPEGQRRSHAHFLQTRPDHSLHVLPGMSHLDPLVGKDAAREVFPMLLDELDK